MRVLLAVAFAVFGICLAQANAVPTARQDESSGSGELSLYEAGISNENSLFKLFTTVKEVLEKIFKALLEGYLSVRSIIIQELTLLLKFLNIDFDVEKWLTYFETALVDCGRTRRKEMSEGAERMVKDALGCVRVNVDKMEEIRERSLKAFELLSQARPYFHEQYERCQKEDEKPTEPNPGKPSEPQPTQPHQPADNESGSSEVIAQGRSMTCLAKSAGKTWVLLKPVPGHLYALAKMIFNVSVNDKNEVIKCFKEKWPIHLQFFQTTVKSYALCVVFS